MSPLPRLGAIVAATLLAGTAFAQSTTKPPPFDVTVINGTSRPVPVRIVTPAAPATVTCRFNVTGFTSSATPFAEGGR